MRVCIFRIESQHGLELNGRPVQIIHLHQSRSQVQMPGHAIRLGGDGFTKFDGRIG